MSSVLEEHDEAEREKHKQDKPKKTTEQRHALNGNLRACKGQRS